VASTENYWMRHPTSPRSFAGKRCHDPIFVPSHEVFVTPHPKLKEIVNLHYCCLNLATGFTKTEHNIHNAGIISCWHKQRNLTSSCTGTRWHNFLLKETVNLHYCCLNLVTGFTKTEHNIHNVLVTARGAAAGIMHLMRL
jgi:hypothetical protein